MNKSGILCLYKPKGLTSFDAIHKVKRKFGVKTGHSGTLDPEAEGILIVAINNATKALPYIGVSDKVYEATLTLGLKTDTGDIWGEVVEKQTLCDLDENHVKAVVLSMVGKMKQRVPSVSAKKINGKKLYEYHRQNQAVETLYTDIEIYAIEFLWFDGQNICFRAHVSNGTYIRTLCEDIAEKLETIGSMSSLLRSKVGNFTLKDAHLLEDIECLDEVLLPTKDNIALPVIKDTQFQTPILHGKRFDLPTDEDLVFVDCGEVFAVCERTEEGNFRVKRGLW
ncbi:hypothetical protein AOC36_04855 [Erysipelothrix larvae]|uniref:tRNA pseudouridine synthase B n=1 Tax=Erysipelothrix larvae TaxID=1514105 RepID=A0A0X8GZK1_9FIRM|nr:tRNA pseudouridine(55) synthase TruB [Erysipelothrix larvae]AMC93327.1 hypothetical protein AOC36_04855 [Erysipelothrix larvae]